jgi:hypothetical protein
MGLSAIALILSTKTLVGLAEGSPVAVTIPRNP